MEQRITLLTLGVRDLSKSTAFFERLGWKRSVRDAEGVSFFQCGSIAISLWSMEELAEDAGISVEGAGFRGVAIAHNVKQREDVDALLAEVVAAGGTVVRQGRPTAWGGYIAYFNDLDGHLWEVAWNPGFPLDDSGAVHLPD